jgi:hypothetical protein
MPTEEVGTFGRQDDVARLAALRFANGDGTVSGLKSWTSSRVSSL